MRRNIEAMRVSRYKSPAMSRAMKMMSEAAAASMLFKKPGAFNFRPTWRRPSAGVPSKMYRRHATIGREVRMAKKLFAKKSAFRFRPKWRGVKRKRATGFYKRAPKKWGRGKGRGASMYSVRSGDKEWVKFAKKHGLRI